MPGRRQRDLQPEERPGDRKCAQCLGTGRVAETGQDWLWAAEELCTEVCCRLTSILFQSPAELKYNL